MPNILRVVLAIVASLVWWSVAGAATYAATPENYRRTLPMLRAGDTLALAPGEYREGLPLHNLAGEAEHPITIAGPARGTPAILIANEERNTVSIIDSHHIVVKNLTLDGRNVPVDGVKAEGHARYAHHITLENLVILGHGNNQQNVGISTKCPAWNWVIRGNTIIGAGTGMYLGNSDGNAPFVAGVIERNLIVDTIGYNLQIKQQNRRPALEDLPVSGASVTVIRRNVFAKTADGSTTAPRPNVLVGHFPPEGSGVDDRYVIYSNFFYANRHEALFQGEGNVALYNNLFVNPYGDAIHIQPHYDIPKRIDIAFNTVLAERVGISVLTAEGSTAYPQSVLANAVFAAIPIVGGAQVGNFSAAFTEAGEYLTRPFAEVGELDVYPRTPLTSANADPPIPAFAGWDHDFNGRPRKSGSIGAYASAGTNPGWHPALSLMPN